MCLCLCVFFHSQDRDLWLTENNVATMQLEANSSAECQPCDCAHGYFRACTDVYENISLGYLDDPMKRSALQASLQIDRERYTCTHYIYIYIYRPAYTHVFSDLPISHTCHRAYRLP